MVLRILCVCLSVTISKVIPLGSFRSLDFLNECRASIHSCCGHLLLKQCAKCCLQMLTLFGSNSNVAVVTGIDGTVHGLLGCVGHKMAGKFRTFQQLFQNALGSRNWANKNFILHPKILTDQREFLTHTGTIQAGLHCPSVVVPVLARLDQMRCARHKAA